ncbi:MAG: multidrug effflux MFS transporter, partial [Pseudomonadota bacterium]
MTETAAPPSSAHQGGMWIIIVLALVSTLGPFAIDMHLPALPAMAETLNTSAGMMKLTISAFLIGGALGPLFLAPLSDAYGRKRVQTGLLMLFIIVTAGCAMAETVEELIALRFLQSVAGGAAMASTRAMLSDLYKGDALSRASSILMSVFAIAPVIAPLIGAWVLEALGWRWVFWALGIVACASALLMQTLPETLPPERRSPYRPRTVIAGYWEILKSRAARRYLASVMSFAFMFFAMLSVSPFIYIDHFGMSETTFAWIFAAMSAASLAGNYVNAKLVFRFGYDAMLKGSTAALALLAVAMALVAATGVGGWIGVFVVMVWVMGVFHVSLASTMAGLMEAKGERAGAASAAMSFCRWMGGAAGAVAAGAFDTSHP